MSADPWQILVVDDEPDVHQVTALALKRRRWRGRRFELTSVFSRAEAERILVDRQACPFHVALVDVVMETNHAGLDLCRYIRASCPRSLRIVVRTGQPGLVSEVFVLDNYDVDHYLPQTEATAERLYGVLRACLLVSEDIEAILRGA